MPRNPGLPLPPQLEHTYCAPVHVFNVPLRIQHGRPKSKGAGHALNALYVGTPLVICNTICGIAVNSLQMQ